MGDIGGYLAGVGIALASTGCNAIGLTCQKLTHRRLAALAAEHAKAHPGKPMPKPRYFTQPLWLVGIGAMVIGALLSFAVFNFLGQSRASAMASECGGRPCCRAARQP